MQLINLRFYNKTETDTLYVNKDDVNLVFNNTGLLFLLFEDYTFTLTAEYDDSYITFTVYFADENNTPLPNVPLQFLVNKSLQSLSLATNSNGVCEFTYTGAYGSEDTFKCRTGNITSNILSTDEIIT